MPGWNLKPKFLQRSQPVPDTTPVQPMETDGRKLPPPRQSLPSVAPEAAAAIAKLRSRREQLAFDLERAESAHDPDNPWADRIALLDDTLATIEHDLADLAALQPLPLLALPPTPITHIAAQRDDPIAVTFRIAPEGFRYEEETDWDQRGGPVVRGELVRRAGDASRLAPGSIPDDRREDLARHLIASTDAFAVDLRNRALEASSLPAAPTLADLAEPCPVCGNWREWGGTCATCAQRAFLRQQLNSEAIRIAKERDAEEEDRHKWAERLPVARRRMLDLDQQIAALENPKP